LSDVTTLARINDMKKYRPDEQLYIAFEAFDFSWYKKEVERVIRYWKYGLSLAEIGKRINRDLDEIAILLMDLGRKGKIKPRKNGIWGGPK